LYKKNRLFLKSVGFKELTVACSPPFEAVFKVMGKAEYAYPVDWQCAILFYGMYASTAGPKNW
jgi:hypothetical protein